MRLMLRNREELRAMDYRWSNLLRPCTRCSTGCVAIPDGAAAATSATTMTWATISSRRFLDPSMMYSCAVFEKPEATLAEAQFAKLDRICRKLQLTARDRVVEIGTGWGGFAIHAARYYGCHVTTATISQQQFDLARERVREAGLEDHVDVVLRDYRDLEGTYDKLVSIEMIEAVGHQYFDAYFRKVRRVVASRRPGFDPGHRDCGSGV
jgi:cyclopropane-fatty-acyl-phospholipid synthase